MRTRACEKRENGKQPVIVNMEDGEGGAWSVPLLFYTERKWSGAYFSLFKY